MEAAMALERFIMGGGGFTLAPAQPRELAVEVETHLRALLRDVICGYLDADLKVVADDILLEAEAEPDGEITARDLRVEEEPEPEPEPEPDDPDTAEMEPVSPEAPLEGVTASSEWSFHDPEDYSAPV
jgi:hypothetical protein